jgi:sigma-B regulation protein RsbU (phosphoserine phosphatase)
MIASVQSSLRTAALFTGEDLATLLKIVNLQAYASSLADRYTTVFYGVFDKATRTLRYVNAGHTPPIVLRRDGSIDTLEMGGAPVGMFSDSPYEEGVAQLDPGDVVITYTDGVIEAENQSGEEWGVQGLLNAAARARQGDENAEQLVRSIFNSMDGFNQGCQMDDATIAVLRVL